MGKYLIASQEAAALYGVEEGAETDLDLTPDEERAVVAAGWLEPTKKQQKEAK